MAKLLILCCLLFVQQTFAQPTVIPGRKPRSLTPIKEKIDPENRNCVHQAKYTAQKRLQFYPFNKAANVVLASFPAGDSNCVGCGVPKRSGVVNYARLIEIKKLTKNQIDALTDILYNVSWKGKFLSIPEPGCYLPRNAILFIDSTGNAFAYMEICFECQNYEVSSSEIRLGDFCEGKYEMLKSLFRKSGILYGTGDDREYQP